MEDSKEFSEYINKRNVIECVSNKQVTKQELIKMIEENFPDEEVRSHGQVAQITTTTMTDGTQCQSVLFGKILQ